jgi:hypothetical protein
MTGRMDSEDKYIKASRYDVKAGRHNFKVFHCRLTARPWRALLLALFMGLLAANGFCNLIDSPRWNHHPWQGWTIGAVALFCSCYFLLCAATGFFALFATMKKF